MDSRTPKWLMGATFGSSKPRPRKKSNAGDGALKLKNMGFAGLLSAGTAMR